MIGLPPRIGIASFLKAQHILVEMERDFIDVVFTLDGQLFIGEIKVTTNLTVPQAFRTALGQVIEYGHFLFPELPHMITFLDQVLDSRRVAIASAYGITIVAFTWCLRITQPLDRTTATADCILGPTT